MLRRIGVLTSLAVTAAMFAGVPSAQAQTNPPVGTSLTCIFDGQAQLNPAIPNTTPDTLNGGLHDVERGSYNFGGDGECVLVGGAGLTVQTGAVIGSTGFYDNIDCGTGWAHDLDSSGTFVDLAVGLSFGGLRGDPAGYEIEFKSGKGEMFVGPDGQRPSAGASEMLPAAAAPHTGSHAAGDGGVHAGPGLSATHGSVVSNWVGDGDVTITPGSAAVPNENCKQGSPPDPDGDTDAFRVTGAFEIEKYQVGADGVAP